MTFLLSTRNKKVLLHLLASSTNDFLLRQNRRQFINCTIITTLNDNYVCFLLKCKKQKRPWSMQFWLCLHATFTNSYEPLLTKKKTYKLQKIKKQPIKCKTSAQNISFQLHLVNWYACIKFFITLHLCTPQ